jgi:hypothetical protein
MFKRYLPHSASRISHNREKTQKNHKLETKRDSFSLSNTEKKQERE